MEPSEAAERLITAILLAFEDRDDDEMIPVRSFISEIAEIWNIQDDFSNVPEWETVKWLRERTRNAYRDLAMDELANDT
jgi:hypothetical protein